MLIVMAVVVVLAAAAMPAVSNQVETAKESVDIDNLRALYSEAYTRAYMNYMNGQADDFASTGNGKDYVMTIPGWEQSINEWQSNAPKIGGVSVGGTSAPVVKLAQNATGTKTSKITFTFKENDEGNGIKLTEATLS